MELSQHLQCRRDKPLDRSAVILAETSRNGGSKTLASSYGTPAEGTVIVSDSGEVT